MPKSRNLSAAGLALIKRFEGLRLVAYRDAVGIPTIGYGHTAGVRMGDTITADQADKFLWDDTQGAQAAVRNLVTAPLTQGQYDALVSFVFNLGGGNFSSSTLLRKLNAGDYEGAAGEFGRWVHAGGNRLEGLARRREAERQMFLGQ